MTDFPGNAHSPQHRMLNAIGGATLGGFIALLVGLSNTPVVASTLTVLLGAATVFLALQDQLPGGSPRQMTEALLYRVIGFSLLGVAGLLFGLFLRASDAFGVSPNVRLYENLVEIGVTEDAARELVLEQLIASEPLEENESDRIRRSTTLFSAGRAIGNCGDLSPNNFASIDSVLERYDFEGGAWTDMAEIVRVALGANVDVDAMNLVWALHSVHCAEVE